ncbi:MAG: DapH/DapD/GlmU-related protein [Anaerolineae bacterium]
MRNHPQVKIHPTADVAPSVEIGPGTVIWRQCHIRQNARIGRNCILGKGVYVDVGVTIGDNVKLQNGAMLFHGATIEGGVFVGPGAIITNDARPRAINPDGTLKGEADWVVGPVKICYGASIGAGAVILPNITVGQFALVGAGAVVTRHVPDHALVVGNPARQVGRVCRCAAKLEPDASGVFVCLACGESYQL